MAFRSTIERLYALAHADAFVATEVDANASDAITRTPAFSAADPELVAAAKDAPVLQAVEQVRGWLNVSLERVASIVGLGPSTIYYWKKQNSAGADVRPRASSVEQLWRVHSALRAIREALHGTDTDESYGVELWVRQASDGLTPLDLLASGELSKFEARARSLLMSADTSPARRARRLIVDDEPALEPVSARNTPTAYEDSDFG